MKFTNKGLQALKPKAERYEVWESGRSGFGLRVAPTGRKSWIYLYRRERRSRRLTLGVYPRMGLAAAHKAHAIAAEAVAQGRDPGAEKITKRRVDQAALTVAELAAEYLEKWAKPRKKSWREDQRLLEKDLIPELGRKKAKDVRRRDIIMLLDQIVDRGSPIAANRTLAVVRKMFNFALQRDIVYATPCAAIIAPAKENRRDRVLSQTETVEFWLTLPDCQMPEAAKLALRFLLVTAQRRAEVAGARWDEIDLEGAWWTIPGEKSKNGLPHRVPLSALALALLEEARDLAYSSEWVFPAPSDQGSIPEDSLTASLRHNLHSFEVKESFTPHDLRRTAASHMTGSGTSRLAVKKVLNHADPDVTAVYDRHSYDREKRLALDSWGRQLEAWVEGRGSSVVEIRK